MKKLLKFLISSLVENPSDVHLEEKKEGSVSKFILRVNPDDLKIVIGKQGKTIRAIRHLLRVKTRRSGKESLFVLEEST